MPTATAVDLQPPWAAIEHRHLAAFAALAREGSFRAAARELGYSQSTLSEQVAQLEGLVGSDLLVRPGKSARVALTGAGRRLLHHAEPILSTFAAARADVEAVARGREAVVRVGLPPHLVAGVLAPALAVLRQLHPRLEVHVQELAPSACLARELLRGACDVAVGDPPRPCEGIASVAVAPDPYVLAVPAGWPVARRGASAAALLPGLRLAVRGGDLDVARIETELAAAGLALRPAVWAAGYGELMALVDAGQCAAIVPAAVAAATDGAVTLSLAGLVAPRTVVVAHHEERRSGPLAGVVAATVAGVRAEAQAAAPTTRAA